MMASVPAAPLLLIILTGLLLGLLAWGLLLSRRRTSTRDWLDGPDYLRLLLLLLAFLSLAIFVAYTLQVFILIR